MAFPLKSGETIYSPILTYDGESVFDSSSIFVFYYDGGDYLYAHNYVGMTLNYFFYNSDEIRCSFTNPGSSSSIKYYSCRYDLSTSSWGSWGGQASTTSPITYGSSSIDLWVLPVDSAKTSTTGDPVEFSPSVYLYTAPLPRPPFILSDLDPIFNSYGDQINVRLVVTVLAGVAGVSVGLVFLWWGVRKATGALIKAFKKGKLRI